MKILGCFKVVPDLELMSEQDWNTIENNKIDVSFIKTVLNCFDESVLEMMLKLSDLSEGFNVPTQLDALTIGDEICNSYLKTLYALKFSQTIRIDVKADLSFSPQRVAEIITAYEKKIGKHDVIIMGMQNSVGENGKTPILVANKLNWLYVHQVIAIEPKDERHLVIKSEVDGGTLTQKVELPCVLSVGNAQNSYLRVPTLKDRVRFNKKPITMYNEEELGIYNLADRETEELIELKILDNKRKVHVIEGNTPKEKAQKLYHDYLKEKLERL